MSASRFQPVLSDLLRVPGISGVYLISSEGFIIEKAEAGAHTFDEDALAAMLVTVYGSTTQLGSTLEVGKPELTTIEYPGHYIISYTLKEDYLLVVLADRGKAVLGRVRFELKNHAKRLINLL